MSETSKSFLAKLDLHDRSDLASGMQILDTKGVTTIDELKGLHEARFYIASVAYGGRAPETEDDWPQIIAMLAEKLNMGMMVEVGAVVERMRQEYIQYFGYDPAWGWEQISIDTWERFAEQERQTEESRTPEEIEEEETARDRFMVYYFILDITKLGESYHKVVSEDDSARSRTMDDLFRMKDGELARGFEKRIGPYLDYARPLIAMMLNLESSASYGEIASAFNKLKKNDPEGFVGIQKEALSTLLSLFQANDVLLEEGEN